MPVKNNSKQVTSIVKVSDVPNYDAKATQKSEWLIGRHHFKWRRKNLRLAKKRKSDKKKAETKAAKAT